MKRPVARSWIRARFIFLLKSRSNVSRERSPSRKRACWIRRVMRRSCRRTSSSPTSAATRSMGPASRTGLSASGPRGWPPCPRAGACGGRRRVQRDSCGVSCLLIDEIAVERELPDERVDLFEGPRRGRPPLEIPAKKAIAGDLEFQRRLGGGVASWRCRTKRRTLA